MKRHYDIEWLKTEAAVNTVKFIYFWGHDNREKNEVGKFCFSQWYESPFSVNGVVYKTSEHWMMGQKALLFKDHILFEKIIGSIKPGEAKELGRQVRNFDQSTWENERFQIVVSGNKHKFEQNSKIGDYLLKTRDRVLVEASPVDLVWGVGLAANDPDIANIYKWRGLNLLGFALMVTRDFLNGKS